MLGFIAFFLFSCFASSTAEVEITVCDGTCPSWATTFQISYTDETDLDEELKGYLTDRSIIYFYTASKEEKDFKLKLITFQSRKTTFKPLSLSKNFDIYIDVDSGNLAGTLSFNGVDVFFTSSHGTTLRIDELELINCQIDFEGVNSELYVGSLTTDSSIHSFTQVNIVNADYTHSQLEFDITSDKDVTIAVSDKTIRAYYDNRQLPTIFVFQSDDMEAYFETKAPSKCYVNFTGASSSTIPKISFENFQDLIFSGNWPETTIFTVTDKRFDKNISISSYSSVLPISREGTATTLIKVNDSTTITGSLNCPVIFSLLRTVFLNDTLINIAGTYSGSYIDLGSSYIRLTIGLLDIDFSEKQYPFIFRVGTGGASTVSCLKTTELSTRMNQIAIYTDFQKFLTDFELNKLLSNDWDLLFLNMTLDVSTVKIILQEEPFIHGFIPNDSCLTIFRQYQTFVLTATSPSSLPLSICYDGDETICDDGEYGAEIHKIDQLNSYFVGGIKILKLTLKVSINELDFSAFDASGGYQNCQVTIIGSYQIRVNKVSFGMQKGIDFMEFDYINFDGVTNFYINSVEFKHCNASSVSQFNFQNNQVVTGDDDFVRTFSSNIKSSLQAFRYKMDHYDAISVDSKQFIFYDLDVNDFSTPISFNYDLISNKFAQIIYDIGMTSTATENNLNLTINTETPPSFNITFDVLTYDYRNEAELILYSWSKAKSADFKVNFDHGNYPIKIILTEPYNPTQLNVIGDGKVTYVNRYSNFTELCACEKDLCNNCPSNSSQIKYSDIGTYLDKNEYNQYTIYILQSEMAETKPSVTFNNIDKKIVYFVGLGTNHLDTIILNNDNSYELDQKLTTTHFTNLNIKASSGTSRMTFGELRFDDCYIDPAFTNIEISIDDFICNFTDFELFKRVTICDSCIVGGPLATKASTVQFLVDQDNGDLNATLIVDATIELGEGYAKIGETRFNIKSTLVYDIILNINSGKKVTFTKGSDVDQTKIPLVLFNNCKGSTISICDGWADVTSKKYLFLLEEIDDITLILSGENTPLAVSANKGDMNLIAASKSVGISGFFELTPPFSTDRSSITMKYSVDSPKLTESTIKFAKDFDIAYGCTIKFSQPNIRLELSRIVGSQSTALLSVEHYSDLDGDSKVTINQAFKNCKISTDYNIMCSVAKPLSDSSVANYIKNDHILFVVNTADSSSCKQTSFNFIGTQPTTHGFTSTNMKIGVNEATGQISLGFIKNPNDVPWSLCYNTRNKCEIELDESTVSKLDTLLPGGVMNIEVQMGKENTNELNFAVSSFKGSSVSILSTTSDIITSKVKLGQSIISTLTLSRIKASSTESDFSVPSLVLEDGSSTTNYEKFDNLTVDYSSWTNMQLSSYSKVIEIQYNQNDLTFTANGWKLADNKEIKKATFPKLQVNFLSNNVQLLAEQGLSTTQDLKLIIKSKRITIGENFDSIQSPAMVIQSSVSADSLIVTMKSFPFVIFPLLMNAGTLQFDKLSLPYTTTNSFTLNNLDPVLDFSAGDQSHLGRFSASTIDFKGVSSLSVKSADVYYPITVQNVVVNNLSIATLRQTKVSSSIRILADSTLKGTLDVDNSNVAFEWQLNQMPELIFEEEPTTVPNKVIIKFTGPETEQTINAQVFNDYLYEKAYSLATKVGADQCEKWVNKIELQSNVRYFNSDECVFDVYCNSGNLMLIGRRLIPDSQPTSSSDDGGGDSDSDSDGKNKLKPGAIAAISISVVAVVVVACVIGYIYYKRRRVSYESLDSVKLELNKQQYI